MKTQTVVEFKKEVDDISESTFSQAITSGLEACMSTVLEGIKANFDNSSDPNGSPWVPRKDIGNGHPLLVDTGQLKSAATGGHIKEVIGDTLRVGVNKDSGGGGIPGAAVHNYGYPPKNIPKRTFLGLKEEFLNRCENILIDHVREVLT